MENSSILHASFHLYAPVTYTIHDCGSYVAFIIKAGRSKITLYGNSTTNDDLVNMARTVNAKIATHYPKESYILNPWTDLKTTTTESIDDEIPF